MIANSFADFRRKALEKKGIVDMSWVLDGYFKYMMTFGYIPYEQYLNEDAEVVIEIMQKIDRHNEDMKRQMEKGKGRKR